MATSTTSTSTTTTTTTTSPLKAAALMDQMKLHLATDAGKALLEKIGLVYQLNIAPKVTLFSFRQAFSCSCSCFYVCILLFVVLCVCQKIGFNEEIFVVDLKKGEVTKGSLLLSLRFIVQGFKWSVKVQAQLLCIMFRSLVSDSLYYLYRDLNGLLKLNLSFYA